MLLILSFSIQSLDAVWPAVRVASSNRQETKNLSNIWCYVHRTSFYSNLSLTLIFIYSNSTRTKKSQVETFKYTVNKNYIILILINLKYLLSNAGGWAISFGDQRIISNVYIRNQALKSLVLPRAVAKGIMVPPEAKL